MTGHSVSSLRLTRVNGTRLSHLIEDFEGWFVASKMLEI